MLDGGNVLYQIGVLQLLFSELRFQLSYSLLINLVLALPLIGCCLHLLLSFLYQAIQFVRVLSGELVSPPGL